MNLRIDCRYFLGEKPCQYNKKNCFPQQCSKYSPIGTKILIIKLRAVGDVLRTTPILPALKKKYPNSHISWLIDEASLSILEDNSFIDRLIPFRWEKILRLEAEKFDLLISLDKDISAMSFATIIRADEKLGFALSEKGLPYSLNPEAEYNFKLGFSNELKFKKNRKTYQRLMFETAKLDCDYGEYILNVPQPFFDYGKDFVGKLLPFKKRLMVGLNTGAGKVFATKKWTIEGFVELSNRLYREFDADILLLGGPEEVKRNQRIISEVEVPIVDTGCNHNLKEFIGILNQCDVIVTGDTLALHFGIALKKYMIAIFGPTCHQEIDLYGRSKKIISNLSCAPCYKSHCDTMKCMKNILASEILNALSDFKKNL